MIILYLLGCTFIEFWVFVYIVEAENFQNAVQMFVDDVACMFVILFAAAV